MFASKPSRLSSWTDYAETLRHGGVYKEIVKTLLSEPEIIENTDILSSNLSDEQKEAYIVHARENPFFFIRRCVRWLDPEGQICEPEINDMLFSAVIGYEHSEGTHIKSPRQCGRNFTAALIAAHEIAVGSTFGEPDFMVDRARTGSVQSLERLFSFLIELPTWFFDMSTLIINDQTWHALSQRIKDRMVDLHVPKPSVITDDADNAPLNSMFYLKTEKTEIYYCWSPVDEKRTKVLVEEHLCKANRVVLNDFEFFRNLDVYLADTDYYAGTELLITTLVQDPFSPESHVDNIEKIEGAFNWPVWNRHKDILMMPNYVVNFYPELGVDWFNRAYGRLMSPGIDTSKKFGVK
jgi:hypothetical protein